MFTQALKWVSTAGLLLAVLFWKSAGNYYVVLDLLVCTVSALIVLQAVREGKYGWAVCFIGIGLVFNPAITVVRLAGDRDLAIALSSIVAFAGSLKLLVPGPVPSVLSITDRTPGSMSL